MLLGFQINNIEISAAAMPPTYLFTKQSLNKCEELMIEGLTVWGD